MSIQDITVRASEHGERIDTFLSKKTGITRSQIQKLIEKGCILVGNRPVAQSYKIRPEDAITLNIVEEKSDGLVPEPLPVNIMHKDDHIIVVDKPPGMVVYPAAGHTHGTLMNAISYYCRRLAKAGGPLRPGVVHRLDKDTSGVMVVALNDEAYHNLTAQFRKRAINRKYIVLIHGNLKGAEGEISLRIGRSESDRKKMSTRARRGKEAVTRWKVIERLCEATLVEARLGTGRTHQIRVHFSSMGHPVLGDRTYGKKIETGGKKRIHFPRQMLHAEILGFTHPSTGEYIEFSSPLPEDMAKKIKELRNCRLI